MISRCLLLTVLSISVSLPCATNAQWIENGIVISDAAGDQIKPKIIRDNNGGAILVWSDGDIYAQRVDLDGNALWSEGGVPVCTSAGDQVGPQMTSDGAGGAIITWCDFRGADCDIYAQRINAQGNAQWSTDGIPICTSPGWQAYQELVYIISDGSGGAIISWDDSDIYAQKVDSIGNILWTLNGVPVCTQAAYQYNATLASDSKGGAIIVWMDQRPGELLEDLYAQRIDSAGNAQWTTDGVPICTAANPQAFQQLVADDSGGAIITWTDQRNGPTCAYRDIYVQRVNSDGSAQWAPNGIGIATNIGTEAGSQLVPDGSGGAVIAYLAYYSPPREWDIQAQRINSSGTKLWGNTGRYICFAEGNQDEFSIIPDNFGGSIISWKDARSSDEDIYAQRVNQDGTILWIANGSPICTVSGMQQKPQIIDDGYGGAFIAWQDNRNSEWDIFASKIDYHGNVPPTATVLQDYLACINDYTITVCWTLYQAEIGKQYKIYRIEGSNQRCEELISPEIKKESFEFNFEDSNIKSATTYRYRITILENETETTLFTTDPITVPELPAVLYQNCPNPFNPTTTIRYYLPDKCKVTLQIFDVSGKRVRVLVDGEQLPGLHEVGLNASSETGILSSGVYFYRLTAGKDVLSRKMVLLR